MKKSAELIGLPVISISEGCEFGKVKELLVNAAAGTISALVLEVNEKKWYFGAKLIPFESVIGIGDSALIIENSRDILPFLAREEFQKFFEAEVKVIGTKVLTRNGKFHGKVIEFSIDATGKIELCEMEQPDGTIINIPSKRIVTFGKEILIIHDEGEADIVIAVQPKATAPLEDKKPAPQQQAVPEPPIQEKPANDKAQPEPQAQVAPAIPVAPVVPPKPAAVQQPITNAVAAPKAATETPGDAAAKKTEGKPRDFLIGKKATRRIESEKGALIIEENGIVTEEVLQKATLANKLIDLSMSVV